MKVYELRHTGRGSTGRLGLFKTKKAAKKHAAEKIEEYRGYGEDDGFESVIDNPTWGKHREYIGRYPVGAEKPIMLYGEQGSGFVIDTVEVLG